MKKLFISALLFVFLVAVSVTMTAVYYQRALVQQRIFLYESDRLEAINIASNFYWFPTESFKHRIICNVYERDEAFKDMTESYGESFLRSSGIHPELQSHAQHIYDLFEISSDEVSQMCRK